MMKADVHLPIATRLARRRLEIFRRLRRGGRLGADYAFANRGEMLELILEALHRHLPAFEVFSEAINCHHNYVQQEEHFGERVYVTARAPSAHAQVSSASSRAAWNALLYRPRQRQPRVLLFLRPRGRAPHEPNEAKRRFSRADLIAQTQGVECRKDKGVLDEIPGAYKDIDQVMADQIDLVDVAHTSSKWSASRVEPMPKEDAAQPEFWEKPLSRKLYALGRGRSSGVARTIPESGAAPAGAC